MLEVLIIYYQTTIKFDKIFIYWYTLIGKLLHSIKRGFFKK